MGSGSAQEVKDGSPARKPAEEPSLKAHVCCSEAPVPAASPAASPAAVPAGIKLRPFPIAKVDALVELYRHSYWAGGRRKADVVKMLKHTPLTLSAWDGPRLVGFCRVLTDFVYRAGLYDVIVHEDYRGRGVGKLLVDRVMTHPKLRRVERWFLSTRDKHTFYEQFGWRRATNMMELQRGAKK
jgi:GNAT superfamily N-acetyltransferase